MSNSWSLLPWQLVLNHFSMMQWLYTLQIHNFYETAARLKAEKSEASLEGQDSPPHPVSADDADTQPSSDRAESQANSEPADLPTEVVR